ncbi:MAG: cytochrome c oxidase subunit 3 [Gammaproteobacteria bacterium]|nr:cytochrome c oxidase subunit 3 [Gammaproteobacteria bacterium]
MGLARTKTADLASEVLWDDGHHPSDAVSSGTTLLWDSAPHQHDAISTRTFGFWLYMLSDAMILAALFTAYAVLSHSYAGGPTAADIIHPRFAFRETLLIFSSVLALGLSMSALKQGNRIGVVSGIVTAFVIGAVFLVMEFHEFAGLISHGITPERSGFLSAYYAMVLVHSLHLVFGLLWMGVMLAQIMREGFTDNVVYRLLNLKIFWQFQAVIWVCVFTFIYL